ncbi:ATP-grasp domain-containing protein [Cloacibacillus evryensis]
MTPKIAIIGANNAINNLILKAKEKGYETHVFAWKCGDVGEQTSDYFYPISVAEKEAILNVCKHIGVSGVASVTSDFAVNTVNYVARNLGLTCNSEKTDIYARNKYIMRCAFRDAGLYVPWFRKIEKTDAISSIKDITYPLIVKPIDRWSSKGVTQVNSSDGLKSAVELAKNESLNEEAIIEGLIDGPEYSCECICYHGEYHALAMTQKHTTGFPHYIETGHSQPSDIPDNERPMIEKTIFKALKALDIKNGAAHVEFKNLMNGNIGIIEIGARMGGDCIGTDLVQLTTGYDYLGMVIDVACGKEPDMQKGQHYSSARVTFILDTEDYETYLKNKANGHILYESEITGDTSGLVTDSATRHGYYIIAI